MALVDRLAHDRPSPASETDIANHAFSAAVWFASRGVITRAAVVGLFSMTVEDELQLDQLIAYYVSLSTAEKRAFHSDLEAAGILLEGGFITKTQYMGIFGLV